MKFQNAGDPPESEDEEGVINDDQEKVSSSEKTDDDQPKNTGGTAGLTDADIEVLRGRLYLNVTLCLLKKDAELRFK